MQRLLIFFVQSLIVQCQPLEERKLQQSNQAAGAQKDGGKQIWTPPVPQGFTPVGESQLVIWDPDEAFSDDSDYQQLGEGLQQVLHVNAQESQQNVSQTAQQFPQFIQELPQYSLLCPEDEQQLPLNSQQFPQGGQQLSPNLQQFPHSSPQVPLSSQQIPQNPQVFLLNEHHFSGSGLISPPSVENGQQFRPDSQPTPENSQLIPQDGPQLAASPQQFPPKGLQMPLSSQQYPVMDDVNENCVCVPYHYCKNSSVNTDGTGSIDIRIKPVACDFYQTCCAEPLERDRPRLPPPTERTGCGQRHPEGIGFRITGGSSEAQFAEFPWMVGILKRTANDPNLYYQCGGALIHESVVLTAAHCVKTKKAEELLVRAGEWDTQHQSEVYPHIDVGVASTAIHPGYSSGSLWNDLALLFLERPLQLGENIDTICLPAPGEEALMQDCFASGWGKDQFGDKGKSQVILKKVELPLVDSERCEKLLRGTRLGPSYNLHDSFLCAGGVPGKDTCNGDGGSPLVCPVRGWPGHYEVRGIVSWGIGCGGEVPGLYANVARLVRWIHEQLGAQGLFLI